MAVHNDEWDGDIPPSLHAPKTAELGPPTVEEGEVVFLAHGPLRGALPPPRQVQRYRVLCEFSRSFLRADLGAQIGMSFPFEPIKGIAGGTAARGRRGGKLDVAADVMMHPSTEGEDAGMDISRCDGRGRQVG